MNVNQASELLGVSSRMVYQLAAPKKLTELYRHFDSNGVLLYVGISASAIKRFKDHKNGSHWSSRVASITIERYETRQEAEQAETNAIVLEKPLHNKSKRGIKPEKLKTVNFSKHLTPALGKSSLEKTFESLGIKIKKS